MIGIVDGDALLYMACTAKWKYKYAQPTVQLDMDGNRIAFEIPEGLKAKYYQDAINKFHDLLDRYTSQYFCTTILTAVRGDSNFRDDVYDKYKWRRREAQAKNPDPYVPKLRQHVIEEGLAIPARYCEADDMVSIWAEEARAAGEDFIIFRVDKDLKMIPGKHFDMLHEQFMEITPLEAHRQFYQQLLMGDPTDSIPGLPKVGPVKAERALKECNSEEEMQERVVDMYMQIYGEDDWRDQLLSNGKLLYIMKHPDDWFSISNWPIVKEITL